MLQCVGGFIGVSFRSYLICSLFRDDFNKHVMRARKDHQRRHRYCIFLEVLAYNIFIDFSASILRKYGISGLDGFVIILSFIALCSVVFGVFKCRNMEEVV